MTEVMIVSSFEDSFYQYDCVIDESASNLVFGCFIDWISKKVK